MYILQAIAQDTCVFLVYPKCIPCQDIYPCPNFGRIYIPKVWNTHEIHLEYTVSEGPRAMPRVTVVSHALNGAPSFTSLNAAGVYMRTSLT